MFNIKERELMIIRKLRNEITTFMVMDEDELVEINKNLISITDHILFMKDENILISCDLKEEILEFNRFRKRNIDVFGNFECEEELFGFDLLKSEIDRIDSLVKEGSTQLVEDQVKGLRCICDYLSENNDTIEEVAGTDNYNSFLLGMDTVTTNMSIVPDLSLYLYSEPVKVYKKKIR